MKRILPLLPLLLFHLIVCGQNLNGFWKGTLNMAGGCFPVNNIELQITIVDNNVIGDSYHYQNIDNYVKKNFKGSYFPNAKKVVLQEDVVSTYKIRSNCIICVKR